MQEIYLRGLGISPSTSLGANASRSVRLSAHAEVRNVRDWGLGGIENGDYNSPPYSTDWDKELGLGLPTQSLIPNPKAPIRPHQDRCDSGVTLVRLDD
ncbi:hypothetical protein [Scytonema sp. PRP1]|uniref:hypothetical protein n=1 Tax=Scytonema sp. PRP1 TaxID=3120513 RepID=UPI002FD2ADED